jgi:hypothetical protein
VTLLPSSLGAIWVFPEAGAPTLLDPDYQVADYTKTTDDNRDPAGV